MQSLATISKLAVMVHIISLQVLNERAVKDTELLNSRLTKLQQDFDAQLSAAEQLAQENNQKAAELKVCLCDHGVFILCNLNLNGAVNTS